MLDRGAPAHFRFRMESGTHVVVAWGTDKVEIRSAMDPKTKTAIHEREWSKIVQLSTRARNAADFIRLVDSP